MLLGAGLKIDYAVGRYESEQAVTAAAVVFEEQSTQLVVALQEDAKFSSLTGLFFFFFRTFVGIYVSLWLSLWLPSLWMSLLSLSLLLLSLALSSSRLFLFATSRNQNIRHHSLPTCVRTRKVVFLYVISQHTRFLAVLTLGVLVPGIDTEFPGIVISPKIEQAEVPSILPTTSYRRCTGKHLPCDVWL